MDGAEVSTLKMLVSTIPSNLRGNADSARKSKAVNHSFCFFGAFWKFYKRSSAIVEFAGDDMLMAKWRGVQNEC